jgi:hypothetical protein
LTYGSSRTVKTVRFCLIHRSTWSAGRR